MSRQNSHRQKKDLWGLEFQEERRIIESCFSTNKGKSLLDKKKTGLLLELVHPKSMQAHRKTKQRMGYVSSSLLRHIVTHQLFNILSFAATYKVIHQSVQVPRKKKKKIQTYQKKKQLLVLYQCIYYKMRFRILVLLK